MNDSETGPGTDADGILAPARTDWLRHVLTVAGPIADVAAFELKARGPSAVPWHLDLDHEEMRLLAPIAAAGPAARGLARVLRAQVEANHQRVLAAADQPGGGCPLDLHRLVPIPARILQLGDDAPASRLWLWVHWGTLQPLRHVRRLDLVADRWRKRTIRVEWEFWSADWSPWRAIVQLRQDWPSLRFDVRPDYGGAADG
ncbi:MAG: hypothetical protein ACRYFY_06245 [Janthinobacterium lividum]